ncbi:hypothetical protein Tco_0260476 [Tanacetum coccineum]
MLVMIKICCLLNYHYPAELETQEQDKENHKGVQDALKNDAIEKASDVNDSDALKNTAADVNVKVEIWKV